MAGSLERLLIVARLWEYPGKTRHRRLSLASGCHTTSVFVDVLQICIAGRFLSLVRTLHFFNSRRIALTGLQTSKVLALHFDGTMDRGVVLGKKPHSHFTFEVRGCRG